MREQLARNIAIYRKEKGLTQEELARVLGISYQAVSKWENAQSMPDIALLPELSRTLEVTVDKLHRRFTYGGCLRVFNFFVTTRSSPRRP